MMTKRGQRFPHTISYRLTDEDYLKLEQEINETTLTPHDWCRMAALEKLNVQHGLTRNERLLFEQVARIQYLLGQGFRLLADDKLGIEEWNTIRTYAKEKVAVIADNALADFSSRREIARRSTGSDT